HHPGRKTLMSQHVPVEQVLDKAIERARLWLAATSHSDGTSATERLADLVRDPAGVRFTMDFVDRVARPEDNRAAAQALRRLDSAPDFLGRLNQGALQLGGILGPRLPHIVMPL